MKGDNWDNYAVGFETLEGDLGRGASRPQPYDFDDTTRDILIAHTRQDAAHALLNTISLLRRLTALRRLVYLQCFAVGVLALMLLSGRGRI
jgi:hypothetical protein